MMIKLVGGPKDASIMGLEVLSKVLKMNEEEYSFFSKKIK